MRQFVLMIGSITLLATLPSACGTKGPLTLPPSSESTQSSASATSPAKDVNTAAGQH